MKYDADYFIKFFGAIPDRKWCMGSWLDLKGRSCAGGFCRDEASMATMKSVALDEIFQMAYRLKTEAIKDGDRHSPARFRKFKRPRTRILHALREAKAKGE